MNEEKQVVFSFELGPHAPRIGEGIVCSKQGRESGGKSLFRKFYTGQMPGRESV